MDETTTRRSALIVATTGSFITPFMVSSVNVALPAIEKNFNIDAVMLSWIATSYLLAAGVSLVPMGRVADIFGRKKILGIGFILFSIASLLSALANSVQMLIFFRVIQGIGSGMIFGTGMAILTSVFPPQERGKVLGIAVSAVYIGLSSGPFIGGMLTQHLTWRSLFGFIFLLSFIPLILIYFKLKGEWAEAAGEKFDIPGSVIYGVTLIAIIYGFSRLPDVIGFALLGIGIVGFILFIVWETKVKEPLLNITLFSSNRAFALSNLAALINYSATFAITFLLSLYFQYIKALSPQATGIILMSQPLTMALCSPVAGRLSDKIEPRIIASIGMLITCVGLLLFSFITSTIPIVYFVPLLIFMGFGFALFSSPNMNAIMSSVEKRYLGIASGSAGTMRVLGQMFSMGIATLVLSLIIGHQPITKTVYPQLLLSIRISFIAFCVLCFMGIFASLSRGNIRQSS